jgi:hypothetical protein
VKPAVSHRGIILGSVVATAFAIAVACSKGPPSTSTSSNGATGASTVVATSSTTATGATASGGSGSGGGATDAGPCVGFDAGAPDGAWDPLPYIDQLAGCCGGVQYHSPGTWPKPSWQPCGVGCQVWEAVEADATPGAGGIDSSSAIAWAGDLYYHTNSSSQAYTYDVLRRLSDDVTFAVTRVPEACIGSSSTAAAPFVYEFWDDKAVMRWMGYYAPSTGRFVLPSAAIAVKGTQDSWFSWDQGIGFLTQGGAVATLTPGQRTLQLLFNSGAFATIGRARDGLIAWTDWSTTPVTIRSWTPDGGVAALTQGPAAIPAIALGDTAIAFLSVTGSQVPAGGYATAQVYWTPYTTDPSKVQVVAGPDVSGQVAGTIETMSTAGDYIALPRVAGITLSQDIFGVLVVQMSTAKLWVLRSRPNMVMWVAGMSGGTLLAMESDFSFVKVHGMEYFQRWLRLDLTKLDQLVTTLPAGM